VDLEPVQHDQNGRDGSASGAGELRVLEPLCAVFRRHLRSLGQKYTPERAAILDTIMRLDDVFEAEALIEQMRGSGHRVSKATVYRTIKLLQDAGIIQQVLLDSDLSHYQLAYGRRPRDLLIRVDTNEIVSIDVPELIAIRDRVCGELGLTPEGHRLMIYATGETADQPDEAAEADG
jgi:Fur family ferric uptake transcriptional regulator